LLARGVPILRRLRPSFVQSSNHIIHLLLTGLYASHNLSRFHTLKGEHFVQFTLKLGDERFLIVFGPWTPFWFGILWVGVVDIRCLESLFEVIVGDIIVIVVLQQRRS